MKRHPSPECIGSCHEGGRGKPPADPYGYVKEGHGHVADGGEVVKIGALISLLRRPVATSAHAFPKTPPAPPGSRAEGRSR